jgi:hypothetical protein
MTVLVLTCLLAVKSGSLAADEKIDGWQLQQKSRLGGKIDLFVCKSAVRIVFPKNGMVFLAAAPWKQTYLYCTRTGHVFKSSFSHVSSPYTRAMAFFDGTELSQIKVQFKGPEDLLGFPSRLFVETPEQEKRLREMYKNKEVTGRTPGKLKYVVTDYFKTEPQVGLAISRFFAFPETRSVPLQFTFTTLSNEPFEELVTLSCKPIKMSSGGFVLPSGLKTVIDGRMVLVPEHAEEDSGFNLLLGGERGK